MPAAPPTVPKEAAQPLSSAGNDGVPPVWEPKLSSARVSVGLGERGAAPLNATMLLAANVGAPATVSAGADPDGGVDGPASSCSVAPPPTLSVPIDPLASGMTSRLVLEPVRESLPAPEMVPSSTREAAA